MAHGPPANPGTQASSALDTRTAVAGKGKRKRRKRTAGATLVRQIDAKARERREILNERHRIGNEDRAPLTEADLLARDGRDGRRHLDVEALDTEIGTKYRELRKTRKDAPPRGNASTSAATRQWISEETR